MTAFAILTLAISLLIVAGGVAALIVARRLPGCVMRHSWQTFIDDVEVVSFVPVTGGYGPQVRPRDAEQVCRRCLTHRPLAIRTRNGVPVR